MAAVPAQQAPEIAGQGSSPDRYTRVDYGSAVVPNPGIGTGLRELGAGAVQAADFFGQVAADESYNSFEEGVNKILYGDPSKKVPGPDGQLVPDTGYMGLKGRAALDAREATVSSINNLRDQARGNLTTLKQDASFDRISRRYKAIVDGQVGNHARTQANVYASNVNSASAKLALDTIAANADDPVKLQEGLEQLTRARVRQAQLNGGGPELIEEAERSAKRDGLTALITSIGAQNPARALSMVERNKDSLGASYDNLYNSLRARADQQSGQEFADYLVGSGTSLKDGADTLAVIRHFEGFRPTAYWDVNAWRVGYGSDTITRADGRQEKVTQDTVVSKEDAERDLVFRASQSQQQVRGSIGNDAWEKLDPRSRASLTSVAYNYGKLPDTVAAAARKGDPEEVAKAIEGLSGHNNGVNRRRRAIEAANVRGANGPEGRDSLPDQAEIIDRITNSNMTPQAQASAIAQVNRTYQASRNAQIKNKAAFESAVKDSTAEAMQTGTTTTPIPENRFLQQYGAIDGPVKYQEYINEVQFGADRHSFETMPEQQIQQVIDARIPAPGTPGYANQIQKVDRLQKYATELQKQRREDPAGAVSRMDAVKEAMKGYDPAKPETFAAVAAARKASQEVLGIEEEYQSPITKAEALKLTQPLKTMLPGQEKETMTKIANTFQRMFGDDAEKAFSYALRAQKVDTETAQVAARVVKKMALGQPVLPSDAASLDAARESDAATKAIGGAPQRPARATPRVIGNPDEAPSVEGSPVIAPPNVPPAAIQFLRQNPDRAADFDQKYGQGRAKEILQKYGPARVSP